MAKAKTKYVCQECGYQTPKWMGRCPDCGAWNSFVEEAVAAPAEKKPGRAHLSPLGGGTRPEALASIDTAQATRVDTGIRELNRVLGGGLVPGELVLLSGDPGIGKSTLTMQLMATLSGSGDILYVSGEESKGQIRSRAERLGVSSPRIHVMTENNIELLDATVRSRKWNLLIIDSVQTIFDPAVQSAPGSVSQLRAVTAACMGWAKGLGIPTALIGHVTKEGNVAGPRVLEHMVDAVLLFEGDRQSQYRVLRGLKNRFGSINEIGVFDMTGEGLVEVGDASRVFLSERSSAVSGAVVTALLEGSRPILVEIQALATKSFYGQSRCMTTGMKYDRVSMLIAVLEKRAGLRLGDQDVYLNVVGGLRVDDPACDLAAAVAIVSSFLDRNVPQDVLLLGEVGLTGELRQVNQLERRLREAAQMGFRKAIVPRQKKKLVLADMEIVEAALITDVINELWRE